MSIPGQDGMREETTRAGVLRPRPPVLWAPSKNTPRLQLSKALSSQNMPFTRRALYIPKGQQKRTGTADIGTEALQAGT